MAGPHVGTAGSAVKVLGKLAESIEPQGEAARQLAGRVASVKSADAEVVMALARMARGDEDGAEDRVNHAQEAIVRMLGSDNPMAALAASMAAAHLQTTADSIRQTDPARARALEAALREPLVRNADVANDNDYGTGN